MEVFKDLNPDCYAPLITDTKKVNKTFEKLK